MDYEVRTYNEGIYEEIYSMQKHKTKHAEILISALETEGFKKNETDSIIFFIITITDKITQTVIFYK